MGQPVDRCYYVLVGQFELYDEFYPGGQCHFSDYGFIRHSSPCMSFLTVHRRQSY